MKFTAFPLTLVTLAFLVVISFGQSSAEELSPNNYERKLDEEDPQPTNCKSSARIACTQGSLADFLDQSKPNVPCNDAFFGIKQSQCRNNNAAGIRKVVIQWSYCNLDSVPAAPRAEKTTGKYKMVLNTLVSSSESLQPGECRTYTDEKEVNLCTEGGIAGEMKYEAFLPSDPTAYCYAYDFMRYRRTWLPECEVSAKVSCELNGGQDDGAQCDGNLFRRLERDDTPICDEVPVTFTFEHCVLNTTVGTVVYENQDDDEKTKIKINSTVFSVTDKSKFPSTEDCRVQTIDSVVNTCAPRAAASLYIHGIMEKDRFSNCSAFDFYESTPVIMPSPPTSTPSQEPSSTPSLEPTLAPTPEPTPVPTQDPTPQPTPPVGTNVPDTHPPTQHPTCYRLRGLKGSKDE